MSIKFLVFLGGGGSFVFSFLGGGVPILFYGRDDFLEEQFPRGEHKAKRCQEKGRKRGGHVVAQALCAPPHIAL